MTIEWVLDTPRTKTFSEEKKITTSREEDVVDEEGNITKRIVEDVTTAEVEVDGDADRVRLSKCANDTSACVFHIRLIYGRLSGSGEFEPAIRDDGIIISGPNYFDLDVNDDGLISEDEILLMSARILRWDGGLREISSLPVEGPA